MDKLLLTAIYEFWFGEGTPPDEVDPKRVEFWMRQNDETDRQIRDRFLHPLREAAVIDWDICELSQKEAVALLVLFDQFPRNIFRTTGEAFAYDHLARNIARQLVAQGLDRFSASERFMLGLPFVHHEDLDDQDLAVSLSAQLLVSVPAHCKPGQRFDLDQALKHREVIKRFGRFPHRNVMLGRVSTPEELGFLETAERGRGF
jgi:uncharacterized protein (DUF924 family)